MSTVSSTPFSINYHSLGARKDLLYSDDEKTQLFLNAIDAMERVLSSNQGNTKPSSIPELVRKIFDDANKDQDLEIIREAMRPTSRLSLHSISATGQKLLAMLAILKENNAYMSRLR